MSLGIYRNFPQVSQRVPYRVLPLRRYDKKQKSSAAGTTELSAPGPGVPRSPIPCIDLAIGDGTGESAFLLPALIEDATKNLQVAATVS
jgi:hypothetical protein